MFYCKLFKGKDHYLHLQIPNSVYKVPTTWHVLANKYILINQQDTKFLPWDVWGKGESGKMLDVPSQPGMKNMAMWKRLAQRKRFTGNQIFQFNSDNDIMTI